MTAVDRVTRYTDAIRQAMFDAEPATWEERDCATATTLAGVS